MANIEYNKLKSFAPVFILLAASVAVYFLFYSGATHETAGNKIRLTIGTATPLPPAVEVADGKGFFKDAGFDVDIQNLGSGRAALTALLENKGLDVAIAANLPVVFNSFDRDDYAVFAGYGKNDNFNRILVREDKGIKIPADLKGKKIGLTKGSSAHYFLDLFLNANGLKASDVEIINIDTLSLPKALADGQIDAISTWEPHIGNAKKMIGADARVFLSAGVFIENFYFIAKKDFIEKNQDALARFLKAVDRGNNFLKERPLESLDIISKRSGTDKSALISYLADYEYGLYLDQAILISLEKQANWAVKNGLANADKIPDYRDYIYTEVLSALNPKSVTIHPVK